ncbi:MAG TPA: hypothetical protein VKX24_11115, partial [Acidimicrobiia bacterium]|nr:hypothetical protein [Acidimicrobiia bacterium]
KRTVAERLGGRGGRGGRGGPGGPRGPREEQVEAAAAEEAAVESVDTEAEGLDEVEIGDAAAFSDGAADEDEG